MHGSFQCCQVAVVSAALREFGCFSKLNGLEMCPWTVSRRKKGSNVAVQKSDLKKG
jgi:hypothetical protein